MNAANELVIIWGLSETSRHKTADIQDGCLCVKQTEQTLIAKKLL